MNKSTGIMETEEREEKTIDKLTKEASNGSTMINFITFLSDLSSYLMTGYVIFWDSQWTLNYEVAYLCYGLSIGSLISISVKLLSYKVDLKYRYTIFSLVSIDSMIMDVLTFLTLYLRYFLTEEDLIKICGWECPLPLLMSGMTFSFCHTCALIFCICWLCCRFENSWLMKKFISILFIFNEFLKTLWNKDSTPSIKTE